MTTTGIMKNLIDLFNVMLETLPDDLPHVTYLDLRGTLSNELAGNQYRQFWDNELHPEDPGFLLVAQQFDQVLHQI